MIPVCVGGMHRSGTSLTSMLLHMNGIEMGDKKQLETGASGNPKGFWENHDLVKFNDEVLALHGGNWFNPPIFPANWQNQLDPSLDEKAYDLIARYQDSIWGWKDPRNSLTIPIWRRYLPNLKVIICLRNPLNIANSYVHTWMNLDRTLALWQSYNERIMLSTTPEDRLIVHYDSFFDDPVAEVVRMLDWLGIKEDIGRVEESVKEIDPDLRHGRQSDKDLHEIVGSPIPHDERYHYVAALYDKMLKEMAETG